MQDIETITSEITLLLPDYTKYLSEIMPEILNKKKTLLTNLENNRVKSTKSEYCP